MIYSGYNLLLNSVAPLGALWLRVSRRHRVLRARFRPPVPELPGRPIWVQACSVGEVNVAKPLVAALRAQFPDWPVLLTVSTATGHELAQRALTQPGPLGEAAAKGVCALTWFPFDTRRAVRHLLQAARPRALVLLETELWPNVLRESRRAGVPVLVVNGRLSDRHFARYRRWRHLLRPVMAQITAVGAQNGKYAGRFRALGIEAARVAETGSTKFDSVTTKVDAVVRRRLRAECGFGREAPVLVFGSTRRGDEALAAVCWRALREAVPGLRLVIAPRHLARIGDAMAPFDEPVLRRSEVVAGRAPQGERVVFVDTFGELMQFYSVADVAVIGGSFYPGVGGHNPLEPAALGVATVFGPHMSDFDDAVRVLLQAEGARRAYDTEALPGLLRELLLDGNLRRALGTRGRKAVLENQGAIERNVALLAATLGVPGPPDPAGETPPA